MGFEWQKLAHFDSDCPQRRCEVTPPTPRHLAGSLGAVSFRGLFSSGLPTPASHPVEARRCLLTPGARGPGPVSHLQCSFPASKTPCLWKGQGQRPGPGAVKPSRSHVDELKEPGLAAEDAPESTGPGLRPAGSESSLLPSLLSCVTNLIMCLCVLCLCFIRPVA